MDMSIDTRTLAAWRQERVSRRQDARNLSDQKGRGVASSHHKPFRLGCFHLGGKFTANGDEQFSESRARHATRQDNTPDPGLTWMRACRHNATYRRHGHRHSNEHAGKGDASDEFEENEPIVEEERSGGRDGAGHGTGNGAEDESGDGEVGDLGGRD